ncbi:MAG TPA: NAD(P)-dependent oxidoreductase [Candidatus Polarisedimenticolaceae bacterium]|nr:NAD(P)-dependent oxidoreductase [Candidatus Polarisedimenticolaceae bacterium]
MKRPLLVLGATGRLGRAVTAELDRRGIAHDAPSHVALDLFDHYSIWQWRFSMKISGVINVAGFTDVDAAERPEHRVRAQRLNAETPHAIAEYCAAVEIPLVHISTDYVFDGEQDAPYREEDAVNPLQFYGVSKLDGERGVTAANPKALIVRVSTLYGLPERPAYVDKILAAARAKGEGALEVVELPVSSPTYAVDLAPVLLDLMDKGVSGIVHAVNDGGVSRLDLARAVVEVAGLGEKVELRTRPPRDGDLRRPAYSVLGTDKLHSLLGHRLPPWKDALVRYLGSLR